MMLLRGEEVVLLGEDPGDAARVAAGAGRECVWLKGSAVVDGCGRHAEVGELDGTSDH